MPAKRYEAEFTINRSYWRKSGSPRLLTGATSRARGSMDIFGSLALSLGIPTKVLLNRPSLAHLPEQTLIEYPVLLRLLAPSLSGEITLSPFARSLMAMNYSSAPLSEKEDMIRFYCLSNGLFPHFRG